MTERKRFLRTLRRAQEAFRPGVKTLAGRRNVLVSLARRAGACGFRLPPESPGELRTVKQCREWINGINA